MQSEAESGLVVDAAGLGPGVTDPSVHQRLIQSTPFGPVGLLWKPVDGSPRVVRVLLSKPGAPADDRILKLYPGSKVSSCTKIDRLAAAICGFLEGEAIDFPLEAADLSQCSAFQRRVLQAEHVIPRGSTSTYRLIAEHLGKKNAARAVGSALAGNPFPIIVPCHRAVRSDRLLGGYQGGLDMKRVLLEREGIPFDDAGRVACPEFHYGKTLTGIGTRPAR